MTEHTAPTVTIDELSRAHDELLDLYHVACDAGDSSAAAELWDGIALLEVAYISHPDREADPGDYDTEERWTE